MTRTSFITLLLALVCLGFFSGMTYAETPPPPPPPDEEMGEHEHRFSEEEVLTWVEQYIPEAAQELRELKQEFPEDYDYELSFIAGTVEYLEEVKATHPAMFERLVKAEKLEYKSWRVAEEIAGIQDEEQKKQRTQELKQMLNEIFEIRLEERALEIQELEQELGELKSILEKRKAMKETIIERHVQELLSEHDEALSWW